MHITVRRIAAVLAAPALTLSVLAVTSSAASAADDPSPAAAGASWLAGQVPASGIIATSGEYDGTPYSFDDYGLSIDVALALAAAGGHDDVVSRVNLALKANIDAYTAPGYGTEIAAGATAKALALTQAVGEQSTYSEDLRSQLEDTVATAGVIAGRIQDQLTPGDEYAADYANSIGQSFAVMTLDAAGSDSADSATDFLLEQQCEAGFFRQSFAAVDAPDQSCDAGNGKPDVDTTGLAVRALIAQQDDSDVATHLDDAVAWLESVQKPNGSFSADQDITTSNANSTGLAGYALALAGETDPAAAAAAGNAAAWLRAHQAANVANCVYYDAADLGAVAYDNAALKSSQAAPINATTIDQFRRAGAQAVPALLSAPAAVADPHALFAAEYVKAGGKKPVGVIDAVPGEALCAMLGEQSVLGYADANGEAELKVLIPSKTATSKVRVANAAGTFDTAKINALGATKLSVKAKNKVAAGKKQVVRVTGLAPGESVTVAVTWPSKKGSASGSGTGAQANGKGVFKAAFKVPNGPGKAKVVVKGQFGNRRASKTFRVTR